MKITTVNDYVDKVHEDFPELTRDEVKRILLYGWKQILQYVVVGNEISIQAEKYFCFIGQIPQTGLGAFQKYCRKLANRIAYMFRRTKSEWDGYYYFTRSENQYKEYLKQKRCKYKVFKDVFLYKLYEELKVANPSAPYIFRLDEDKTSYMHKYYKEIRTENAELITVRDALNMQDVMTSQNKYKYIQ